MIKTRLIPAGSKENKFAQFNEQIAFRNQILYCIVGDG